MLTHLATAPPLAESRPRRIRFQGCELDTGVCFQRYCALRGAYVVQSARDPFFCLETPHRIPGLVLRGTGVS